MAKVTAVIDIGSNSARMAVFKKTSRFGFHLLEESKARVRISEHSYQNSGNLQEPAIQRAEEAIGDFLKIAKFYGARKILAVATSAVRDAPNKSLFLKRIRDRYKLNIKVIDGEKEAYYGAVAAANLLFLKDCTTIDIGGGSTELAVIRDRKIIKTVSLDIGTVRMKELFFDNNLNGGRAEEFIAKELEKLSTDFQSETIVGIGGTLRALSEMIMKKQKYSPSTLHGYRYGLKKGRKFFDKIAASGEEELFNMGFKKERLDVIKEGTLIFSQIIDKINGKSIVTSGVGVREGVFLSDLLRNSGGLFPENFNPSVRSLVDKFGLDTKEGSFIGKSALKLFDTLELLHQMDDSNRRLLYYAGMLSSLGRNIHFYKRGRQSYETALYGLSYGFSHEERVTIAEMLKYQQKKDLLKIKGDKNTKWLAMILFVATSANRNRDLNPVEYELSGNVVTIKGDGGYLAREYFGNFNICDEVEFVWK